MSKQLAYAVVALLVHLEIAHSGQCAAAPTGLAAVWSELAGSRPSAAQTALNQSEVADPRARELARVVIAMARPSLGEGEWSRAESALARLASDGDALAAQALYLQARLFQVHRAKPDYARAGELYRELARRWPGSHWAQLGLVKLGFIKLYALAGPADSAMRLAEVRALLAGIDEPALRRDLELQLGWAGLFYDRPYDEVLPHLIAADAIGGMLGITPEDLLIQIGELSFRAGHLAQAKRYFERFLAEHATNPKRYNVQQRLREVEAALPARREGP